MEKQNESNNNFMLQTLIKGVKSVINLGVFIFYLFWYSRYPNRVVITQVFNYQMSIMSLRALTTIFIISFIISLFINYIINNCIEIYILMNKETEEVLSKFTKEDKNYDKRLKFTSVICIAIGCISLWYNIILNANFAKALLMIWFIVILYLIIIRLGTLIASYEKK